MINQLRDIFSSLSLYQDIPEDQKGDYHWFLTTDNNLIGIHQQELTDKDTQLLSTFLKPYSIAVPEMTLDEKSWYDWINGVNTHHTKPVTYRFIYFSFQREQIDPSTFKEAINKFFLKQVPVLWESDHKGIIIEEDQEEVISYEAIIDALMSDLSVNIHFVVGPYIHSLTVAQKAYQTLMNAANIARKYSDKAVNTYVELIPYILIDSIEGDKRTDLVQLVLGETAHDDDLLHTIKTFIACNLNVSLTAKALYMHRNSLQYRLNKFSEKTGIDIRNFHEASAVYLAIIART